MSTDFNSPTEPEYLGDAPARSAKPGRGPRGAILGLAAVGVVGVIGLGGWAALSFMSGGTQPASAMPANAIGFVSLDLDPSATQKIEAIKILRKFPAIEKQMKISSQDDLRRWVFEEIQKDGQCSRLDYDKDIAPWIGERIAVAGVPAGQPGKSPTPLVALQVTDQDAASKGITQLARCGGAGSDFGFAFTGDYAVISDSTRHARAIAASAEKAPLADDAAFQKWMDRVGDQGIITAYAAPGAMEALTDLRTGLPDFAMGPRSGTGRLLPQKELNRTNQRLKEMYQGFKGMAAVVRFKDGAVEAQFAGETSPDIKGFTMSPGDHTQITDLPASTGAAFAVALHEGWAKSYLDMMGKAMGGGSVDQMLSEAKARTGLDLPGDVEKLMGDGVAVSLDKSLDVKAASQAPAGIPAGVRISGDPAQIQAALDKVKKAVGPQADSLAVQQGDGAVALGFDQKYVGDLAGKGGLGDVAAFQDVVPDANRAAAAFYLDFDAVESWISQSPMQTILPGDSEKQVLDNLEPLRALGISSWVEDDGTQAGLVRLSTD